MHKKRLKSMKPSMKVNKPLPEYLTGMNKAKKLKELEYHYATIEKDNKVLLDKMREIVQHGGDVT